MVGFLALLVIAIFVIVTLSNADAKKKREAKEAYQGALAKLKANPSSSDLRQQALALGRIYSNVMRDKKGNTLFDEVALMNDIGAACAATHQVIGQQPVVAAGETVEDRLVKLRRLLDKGLIDQDDFSRRKREITDQI